MSEQTKTTTLESLPTRVVRLEKENADLRKCLGFFASAIKSGEPWTATCEAEYRKAMQNV